MSSLAIALVSTAAVMHAYWNLLSKRQNPAAAFFLVVSLVAALVLAPLLIYYRQALFLIPTGVWLLLLFSAGFESLYYVALAGSYRNGDMSLVYPLARALPVLMVTGISLRLGLGKPISLAGLAGILAVVVGCLILPMRSLREFKLSNYLNPWCLLAIVAAAGTTGYTLIDNESLRQLRAMPALGMGTVQVTLFYYGLVSLAICALLGIFVAFSTAEHARLRVLRERGLPSAFLTGLINTAGYSMVLVAMAFASNISYIAAFRQFSIPLGATLGIVVQKEPVYPPKVIGTIGVLLGLILVAVA